MSARKCAPSIAVSVTCDIGHQAPDGAPPIGAQCDINVAISKKSVNIIQIMRCALPRVFGWRAKSDQNCTRRGSPITGFGYSAPVSAHGAWFLTVCAPLWMAVHAAHADGLDEAVVGARGLGKAGAVIVSEDTGAALSINPAGTARRDDWRVQVGVALVDVDARHVSFASPTGQPGEDAAPIDDRAAPSRMPQIAVQGRLGPVIVGAAYLHTSALNRRLPSPRFGQTGDAIASQYPHRYAGTALSYRRHAALVGASMRVSDWLGVGVSIGVAQVHLEERRHIWAGFSGRDGLAAPERDLALTLSGRDRFVPGAHVGLLLAPTVLPLEIGASFGYRGRAQLTGTPTVAGTQGTDFPQAEFDRPRNRRPLAQPITARAGIRYLAERFAVEVGAEMYWYRDALADWTIDGVVIRDQTGAQGALDSVPALATPRSHSALRVAADIEVVAGFLWLSTGYAYTSAAVANERLSPVFAPIGGHALALGAETQWNGITLSVGYLRTLARERVNRLSAHHLVNPFDAGTATIAHGVYQRTRDVVGMAMDISWP